MSADDEFEKRAHATLAKLLGRIDELDLDLEAEFAMGILTIEFPDGAKYVVNSHRAARQIWMAADRAAWHFDEKGAEWVAAKTGEELHATVAGAIGKKLGRAISLTGA